MKTVDVRFVLSQLLRFWHADARSFSIHLRAGNFQNASAKNCKFKAQQNKILYLRKMLHDI